MKCAAKDYMVINSLGTDLFCRKVDLLLTDRGLSCNFLQHAVR